MLRMQICNPFHIRTQLNAENHTTQTLTHHKISTTTRIFTHTISQINAVDILTLIPLPTLPKRAKCPVTKIENRRREQTLIKFRSIHGRPPLLNKFSLGNQIHAHIKKIMTSRTSSPRNNRLPPHPDLKNP